jgi:hypothetical protein
MCRCGIREAVRISAIDGGDAVGLGRHCQSTCSLNAFFSVLQFSLRDLMIWWYSLSPCNQDAALRTVAA